MGQLPINPIFEFFHVTHWGEFWWVIIGLMGQLSFSMRFVLQWIKSERARKSVIPISFWYFSIGGGVILLAYAIHRRDPVFILGQATGLFIYARNLWLIHANKQQA